MSATYSDVTTLAWVVPNAKQEFQLQHILLDNPRDDEVVVEMKYSGICHTDIVLQQGGIPILEYPAVLGHEGAGVIKAIGSKVQDETLRVGDFVLLSTNSCQKCRLCKRGYPVECIEGPRLHFSGLRSDGTSSARDSGTGATIRSHCFGQSSFQRLSYVHETCVVRHPCPADDAAKLAPMGCSYQTGAGTIMNILNPQPDNTLIIFGLGAVGMAALMAARALDVAQIIAVDIQDSKLSLAKELGAMHIVNPKDHSDDLVAKLRGLTDGEGCDYAVDCTGVPTIIETMLECLAMRGTAATVGVAPEKADIRIRPLQYLLGSKRYLGCQGGDSVPQEFIPKLVEMNRRGQFPIERIVKVYDYRDLPRALDDLRQGAVVKPVIQWY
ncbi:Aryl-alcohol dehydrogenase [Pseudocercospora fuligena]|uniref:Aryl-alcohol dehydrogenase n=1 Tax=Pseudocercospora fuligena TaxID=685502 RepID=A0A8H6RAT1_9PEZI|nr:Aryl-alcohol dehydrogenase [Pseudocercospora fuligena]